MKHHLPRSFKKLDANQKNIVWDAIRADQIALAVDISAGRIGLIRDRLKSIDKKLKQLERASVVDALEKPC